MDSAPALGLCDDDDDILFPPPTRQGCDWNAGDRKFADGDGAHKNFTNSYLEWCGRARMVTVVNGAVVTNMKKECDYEHKLWLRGAFAGGCCGGENRGREGDAAS
ncbi:hypothetical protein C2S52_007180 [Perilla frutescens var. hirtella]|nr:hypothetical protein C2S51_008685 [Perilla frutescens var. frutescens]KAH6787628.1 hypothetical protein C2S52_007180 [Perilla frutescens var. hirtella]